MKILITGFPSVGKTTLCKKIFHALKDEIKIGGMITEEIREQGKRVGFKMTDLSSGKEGILAHVDFKGNKKIGKYGVNIEELENIGISALENAMQCDLIILDEIGPMELLSKRFSDKVGEIFAMPKNILATIHFRSRHPIRNRRDVELYILNEANRNWVAEEIINRIRREEL